MSGVETRTGTVIHWRITTIKRGFGRKRETREKGRNESGTESRVRPKKHRTSK